MMIKRSYVQLFSIFAVLAFFAIPLISAQTPSNTPVNDFFRSVTADAKAFFLRFADYENNNNLTVTTLLYFLVFMVISSIVSLIPLFAERSTFFRGIISLVITALSVLLVPKELLVLAINPYSALGITIITILPFIFMFTFVQATVRNVFFRRVIWGLFTLSFVILGLLNLIGGSSTGVVWWVSLVYFLGAIAAAVMIWWGEELEYKIFKGYVKGLEAKHNDYLEMRKVQMDADRKRASIELGVDEAKVGSRKLG